MVTCDLSRVAIIPFSHLIELKLYLPPIFVFQNHCLPCFSTLCFLLNQFTSRCCDDTFGKNAWLLIPVRMECFTTSSGTADSTAERSVPKKLHCVLCFLRHESPESPD